MNTMNTQHSAFSLVSALVLAASVGTLSGCRGEREDKPPHQFFPDLDDAPKWEPQGQSDFYTDGRQMRLPPSNTVAFGRQGFVTQDDWADGFMQQREDLLKEDNGYYEGKAKDGTYLAVAPVRFNKEDLLRGQERFNIYCSACHNYNGDGLGMVGVQWSYTLPNFHDAKYKDPKADQGRDGYLFHIARYGVPGGSAETPDYVNHKMPGYKHALTVDDSWRIVAYIRALQASKSGTIDDVPENLREKVREQMRELPKPTADANTPGSVVSSTGGAK
ncbi:quinol:cytochrome C oxidoreductase [Phycisphaerae bacterium]|nr:quinol:cytochrome C oxidoreductase [Phycisphaerae bacterium]